MEKRNFVAVLTERLETTENPWILTAEEDEMDLQPTCSILVTAAPVWERCIRTVRKVMYALLREQVLDDEGLLTLMCEVEAIINEWPTCYEDIRRFKELRSFRPKPPPGRFEKEDLYVREEDGVKSSTSQGIPPFPTTTR